MLGCLFGFFFLKSTVNLVHYSSNHARKRSKLLPNSALFSSVSDSFGSCSRDAIFLEVKEC